MEVRKADYMVGLHKVARHKVEELAGCRAADSIEVD